MVDAIIRFNGMSFVFHHDLIGGLDYRRSLNPGNPIRIDERRAQRVTSTKKIMV